VVNTTSRVMRGFTSAEKSRLRLAAAGSGRLAAAGSTVDWAIAFMA
jgi:hypothetical protein